MRACSSCGRQNPDDARFCAHCGAALVEAPGAAREERKVITVLFADLVGFTSRSEQLDPEDVRATLTPYFARLREELERRGGTVEKFIGDAVMAVFGAPTTHEDDPERAVRAALAIRDAMAEMNEQDPDLDLHVRVGVTTGEALVSLGVRPLEGEGMAAGDVVNTAARLQTSAPVDGILVDETTFRATGRAIEYRSADPVQAKGKTAPIAVWEALEARSHYGIDITRRVDTALVGRERELDAAPRRPRSGATSGRATARDAGRRARDREEPLGARALRPHRRDAGPDHLATGPVPALRRRRELLGARRDGQGRGGDPRDGHRRRGSGQGGPERHRADRGGGRAALGRPPPAPADRADPRARRRLGGDGGRARGLASLPRGPRRAPPDRPGVRGSALGRRRPPRLPRRPDRLDARRPAPRRLHGEAGAPGPPAGLGRREAERDDARARTPLGRGDRGAARGTPRPFRPARGAAVGALGPRGREPVVRGGVRPDGGGSIRSADLAAAELPGSVQGIIAARLDGLDPEDKSLLQDAAVVGKTFWVGAVAAIGGARASRSRATAPRARTRAVRSPVAPFLGRRRDRIRVPASPRPGRGLRTDPARGAGREAPRGGGLDRVARRRPAGGPSGAPRPPLPVRARADPCRRPRRDGVGGPGPARAASGGRPGVRPRGVRRRRARLRGRGGPLASGRSRSGRRCCSATAGPSRSTATRDRRS